MSRLKVFPSSEADLAQVNESGFSGCPSATANITSQLCAQVWKNRSKPDIKVADEILRQRQLIASQALVPAAIYLVGKRSGNNGWNQVVLPFQPLESSSKEILDTDLAG